MSADAIGIITIDFPDPFRTETINDEFDALALNQSFQYTIQDNIQTLSSKGVERGDDPYGLLYIPDLQTDECKDQEKQYIASNATRLDDLPTDAGYALIAVAPWFSPTCIKEYFTSARNEPVKAIIVYHPDNGTSTPPETNDISWALADGGDWQFKNQFPTYAIPGASGALVVHQLSLYSGNVSTAPYGSSLESEYASTDYIRLYARVSADSGTQLPSLWVFLVIVLGLLILIIGTTSLCMHLVQRRRRNTLRQRVIRGEVDLEALGVKRLTVPQEYLSKLPAYAYPGEPGEIEKTTVQTSIQDAEAGLKPVPHVRRSSAPDVPPTARASAIFAQSTCPICLDDFEPNESQVRELPCRHIFHLDCIDPFLLNNSSLCPICKQSVLPTGYCPAKITNAMVRRERLITQRRARAASGRTHAPGNIVARLPGAYDSLRARVGGASSGGRRIFSAPVRTQRRPSDIEMASGPTSIPPVETVYPPTAVPEIVPAPAPAHMNAAEACPDPEPPTNHPHQRREWARQRALALLGTRHLPHDSEDEERQRSVWKRGLRKIFPGFR